MDKLHNNGIGISLQTVSLWGNRFFFTFSDQLVFSLSNYILNLVLARWMPTETYGAYALGFSLFLFFVTVPIVCDLQDLPVHIWIVPDEIALALHRARAEEFGGVLMFDLRAPALNDYQRMAKRAFDIVMSLLAMPVALPLMGLVALIVRLDSPGPILYRSRRIGENGCIFTMYKFRTMVEGADRMPDVFTPDETGVVLHKKEDDPRVTRAGRILRKLSLDELPQLFNVLKGDMSLVGPRPELPELVQRYNPWQRERFAVPQGMTGWWQVNGRSDKPLHLNTDEDLYYVRNYSIWLDLKILVKTIWVVLRGKGAY